MKSQQNHLPLFGPGPFFGVTVIILTIVAVFCVHIPASDDDSRNCFDCLCG